MPNETKVFEIVRKPVETQMDKDDLISIVNAAALIGVIPGTISRMMDAGSLPWYQFETYAVSGERPAQRFTSRNAVLGVKANARAKDAKGLRRGQYKIGNE